MRKNQIVHFVIRPVKEPKRMLRQLFEDGAIRVSP